MLCCRQIFAKIQFTMEFRFGWKLATRGSLIHGGFLSPRPVIAAFHLFSENTFMSRGEFPSNFLRIYMKNILSQRSFFLQTRLDYALLFFLLEVQRYLHKAWHIAESCWLRVWMNNKRCKRGSYTFNLSHCKHSGFTHTITKALESRKEFFL